MEKIFSIITPTYNSAKTLQMYFDGILQQDYDLSKIEILIIDGGSSDETKEIALKNSKKIDVRVMENPERLPEYAKAIGVNESKGKYCVFQDSDEVLINKESFKIRDFIFDKYKNINNVTLTGLVNPKSYGLWGDYYNSIGDPFSSFMYGPSFSYLEKFSKNYNFTEQVNCIIFNVDRKIKPLIDGVQTFRKKELFETLKIKNLNVSDVPRISDLLIEKNKVFAVTKNDYVLHYSASSFLSIIKKIKFRIINNIYGDKGAGFSNREEAMPNMYKYKKFLFLPYAFLFLPALYDGFIFTQKTRNLVFLAHPIFSFYTAFSICFNSIFKVLGFNKKMKSY